jgi:cellulose synthase/poly-beta-1,6-N-acetylglucosamine synthase-like glycosyltransferase
MVGTAFTYALLFISLYFEVFLLVVFLERKLRREKAVQALPASLPSAAIIVPCYNEEKTLAATLHSLLALTYPADKLQIIVVDDGSTDGTLALVQTFLDDARVRVFHKENGGKHTAMNFGLAHTDAEFVGCLDADSVVAPEALMAIVPVFANEQVAAVTPGIHTKEPANVLQHMQQVEYRLSIFNRFMLAALGSAFITPGPFSIFRASVVRELGGWRAGHSTEDMEMALRMQQAGHLIGNAPGAVVHTATPRTLGHLFRQRVRWTYGFLRNAVDYRSMLGARAYGNLGVIVLPTALISIGAGIFFFLRLLYGFAVLLVHEYIRVSATGSLPRPESPSLFYMNTSAMWFIVCAAVVIVLTLISLGSRIGTGKSRPPIGTPLFLAFYSFLVPLWLSAAVIRAVFRTGVRWR